MSVDDFSEARERAALKSLVACMMSWTFAGQSRFDHMCMSAGEAMGAILEHIGPTTRDGNDLVLPEGSQAVITRLASKPMNALPLLEDTIDAATRVSGQYRTFPQSRSDPTKPVIFETEFSACLRKLDLLARDHVPTNRFMGYLFSGYAFDPIDRRLFDPEARWKPRVLATITALTDAAW